MTLAHIRAHLLLACLGAALAGCGGSEAPAPLPPMPAPAPQSREQSAEEQANASVAAYLDYTRRQISHGTSDTAEARHVEALRPPVSEVDEPAAI
jgi:predicted small lipoprotein YifL